MELVLELQALEAQLTDLAGGGGHHGTAAQPPEPARRLRTQHAQPADLLVIQVRSGSGTGQVRRSRALSLRHGGAKEMTSRGAVTRCWLDASGAAGQTRRARVGHGRLGGRHRARAAPAGRARRRRRRGRCPAAPALDRRALAARRRRARRSPGRDRRAAHRRPHRRAHRVAAAQARPRAGQCGHAVPVRRGRRGQPADRRLRQRRRGRLDRRATRACDRADRSARSCCSPCSTGGSRSSSPSGVPFALLLARSHLRRTADDVLTYQRVSGELGGRLLDAVRGLRTIAASGTADAGGRPRAAAVAAAGRRGHAACGARRRRWSGAPRCCSRRSSSPCWPRPGFGVMHGRLTIGDVLAALGYVGLGMGLVSQIPLLTTLSQRAVVGRAASSRSLGTPMPAAAAPSSPLLPAIGTVRFGHVPAWPARCPTSTSPCPAAPSSPSSAGPAPASPRWPAWSAV